MNTIDKMLADLKSIGTMLDEMLETQRRINAVRQIESDLKRITAQADAVKNNDSTKM
jgi:hypothetical protein